MTQAATLPKTAEHYVQLGDRFRKHGQPVAACRAYHTATKMDRGCIHSYLGWGKLLLGKAKHRAALDKFFKAIKIAPTTTDYGSWISALDKLSNREQLKATQALDQFLADPSKGGYLQWARALLDSKRYSAADEKFGKAIELNPNNELALRLWAKSLSDRGKYGEAVNRYLEAARVNAIGLNYSDWMDAINGLRSDERSKPETELQEIVEKNKSAAMYEEWASALVQRERYQDACDKCQSAARLDPTDVRIFNLWTDALLKQKNYQEALAKCQLAISLLARPAPTNNANRESIVKKPRVIFATPRKRRRPPANLPFDFWVEALDHVNRYQREAAIEQFRKIVGDSNYSSAYVFWGDALARRERYQQATEKYEAAVQLNNKDGWAYDRWGFALEKVGDREGAFEKFRLAYQLDHAFSSSYLERLVDRKQYSKAVKLFSEHVKAGIVFPDLKLWIKTLAQCPVEERETVVRDLWQSAGTSPSNPEFAQFYFQWGQALVAEKDYESAISQYRRALELNPDFSSAQVACANALAGSGNFEEAMRMYLSALEMHPEKVDPDKLIDALDNLNKEEAHINLKKIREIAGDDPKYASIFRRLGGALNRRKRHKEAMAMYENALQLDCEDFDSYFDWGITLSDVKKYHESIEKYQQAIDVNPKSSDVYNSWGNSLLLLRDSSGAIEKFEQALAVATRPEERVYPYMNWGIALATLKDYEGALEKFGLMTELSSDKAEAFFTLGNVLADAKRYEEAREKYRMAIEADSESLYATYSAHNISDSLFGEGRYAEGRVGWEKALTAYDKTKQKAIDAKNANYFQYYGGVLQSIFGQLDEARAVYQEGLKLDPDHVGILTALVSLYLEKKDESASETGPSPYWEARKYYQRAQNLLLTRLKETDEAETGLLLGQLILSLGQYMTEDEMSNAEDFLLKAASNDANAADAYTHLGVLFTRKKEFTKAVRYFTDAFKLRPDDLNVWSNLAEAYLKAATADNADPGLKEKAETEFKKILEAAPNHVESIIGLGEVYKAMGDVAKDEDLYARAVEQFDCGIRIADSAAGSKKLKKRDCAAAQYSAGYAKVKLYEAASTAKDESFLSEALAYFKSAVANDPANFKAKRAAERIEKRRMKYASQRVLEKFGPPVITSGAGVIFLLTQIVFLRQHPVAIGAAAYASLSFGALMFTVAGLSLPQLLKLKVAGIELEKSAVEQITTAGALGISK